MEDEKSVINSSEEKSMVGDEKKQEINQQDIVDENSKDGEVDYLNTDDENTNTNNRGSFFNNLTASVVDVAVISIISVVLLYLIDIIMRNTIGLYITDKVTFLFIIFVIISVLYPCIMNTIKGYTVGASVVKGRK